MSDTQTYVVDAEQFTAAGNVVGLMVVAEMPDLKAQPERGVEYAVDHAMRRVKVAVGLRNQLGNVKFLSKSDPTRVATEDALVAGIQAVCGPETPRVTVDCKALNGAAGKAVYSMMVDWQTEGKTLRGTEKAVALGVAIAAAKYELVNFEHLTK